MTCGWVRRAQVIIAVFALALAACGDDSDDGAFPGYTIVDATVGTTTYLVDVYPKEGVTSTALPRVAVAASSMRRSVDEQNRKVITVAAESTNVSAEAVYSPHFSLWCGKTSLAVRTDASDYRPNVAMAPGETATGQLVFLEGNETASCDNAELYAGADATRAEGPSKTIARWKLTT